MSATREDLGSGLDLRTAAVVLRRRWWLVLGLPVLVLVLSLATRQPPPPVYQARLTFAVDIPRSAIVEGSDEGTAAKIGEALIDDISRIIGLDVFAAAVARRLPPSAPAVGNGRTIAVTPGEIAGTLSATDRHRIADVSVTRAAPPGASPAQVAALQAELKAIAQAVVAELEQNGTTWFARLGEDDVRLTVVAQPSVTLVPPPLRARLEIPLRLALAALIGIGLAFLLHAFDQRLYTETDAVAAAGVPVLGRIPRPAGRSWRRGRRR